MKLKIPKSYAQINPSVFLRRAGYGFIRDGKTGSESYVRRATRLHYPRFHLYVSEEEDDLVFSLHIDHKKASYAGSHRHNAEYEGSLVRGELERLKGLLINES